MTISIISHPDCLLHEIGSYHPECPARLNAIHDQLISSGLDLVLQHHEAPQATREQLYRVHDSEYVESIFHKSPTEGHIWLEPDTFMTPQSLPAALRAAGAVVLGVDLVMSGQSQSVFCNVRPPGHHAEHNKAMGFCIFNNIAVGAAHALQEYQLKKIAIVDFDVHHGNGTEDIFRKTPEILLCSTFQHPFYPHTGNSEVPHHIINVPLPAGTGSQAFRSAVKSSLLPELVKFQPELVLISAGFDAHVEDDMASLNLVEQDFAWITRELKMVADEYANGRIVSVLEGGYALSALGRSVVAHINALFG